MTSSSNNKHFTDYDSPTQAAGVPDSDTFTLGRVRRVDTRDLHHMSTDVAFYAMVQNTISSSRLRLAQRYMVLSADKNTPLLSFSSVSSSAHWQAAMATLSAAQTRRVAVNTTEYPTGRVTVSTCFMGFAITHSGSLHKPFQTCVFGGALTGGTLGYETYDDAISGHALVTGTVHMVQTSEFYYHVRLKPYMHRHALTVLQLAEAWKSAERLAMDAAADSTMVEAGVVR